MQSNPWHAAVHSRRAPDSSWHPKALARGSRDSLVSPALGRFGVRVHVRSRIAGIRARPGSALRRRRTGGKPPGRARPHANQNLLSTHGLLHGQGELMAMPVVGELLGWTGAFAVR